MKFLRSPAFWTAFALFSLSAAYYAARHFKQAIPSVDVAITMNRDAAINAARKIAQQAHWRPAGEPSAVAVMTTDHDLANFIELEAGGKPALLSLVRSGAIQLMRWHVRLFREKDASETMVDFTPDGRLLAFSEKLPDAETAPELSTTAARELAEKQAAALGFDLTGFSLVATQEGRATSGRLDHSFTYERPSPELKGGRQQRVLTVRGNRFSGFASGVKIPDEFFARFSQMRASNKNIMTFAAVAINVVLLLGATFGGLIYLWRAGRLEWKGAVLFTAVLCVLTGLAALTQLPMAWFGYDTATPMATFRLHQWIGILTGLLVCAFNVLLFVSAEGLSRRAFARQPRLWTVFSPRAAGTRTVFGAVLAAYLLCALMVAYEVVMQRFGQARLGWWWPSAVLFDTGALGRSAPWLAPFVGALTAGTTEECMFRAAPLAIAVLLGRRFGRAPIWVGGTLLLQAIIFGAAHSNYPAMPGWARLVELFVPAVVFGVVFLRWGLLPGIMLHFVYDAFLMALPIYTARAPGFRLSAIVIAILTLAPLLWVTYCRLRAGAWLELPEELLNSHQPEPRTSGALQATPPSIPAAEPTEMVPTPSSASPRLLRGIFYLGCAALVASVIHMRQSQPDVPGLTLRRAQAEEKARAFLAARQFQLGSEWRVLAQADSGSADERTFVWQTAGKAVFSRFLGNDLALPAWHVRFVQPQRPLPDRAEEFHVAITSDGSVAWFKHIVPEPRKMARLAKPDAQRIAEAELQRVFGFAPAALELVSALETKQPNRSDWRFVWKNPAAGLSQGEARMHIDLAGDEPAGFGRGVFVPEAWRRNKTDEAASRNTTVTVMKVVLALAMLALVATALWKWRAGSFHWRAAIVAAAVSAVFSVLQPLVTLPDTLARMRTDEPFAVQTTRLLIGAVIGVALGLCLLGFFAGVAGSRTGKANRDRSGVEWWAGLGAGWLLYAVSRLVYNLHPGLDPWAAGIDIANVGVRWFGGLWIMKAALATSVLAVLMQRAVAPRNLIWRTAIAVGLGLAYGTDFDARTWLSLVAGAIVFAVGFTLVDRLALRSHPSILAAVFAGYFGARGLGYIVNPGCPDAVGTGVIALIVALAVGLLLFIAFRTGRQPQDAAAPLVVDEEVAAGPP